MPGGATGSGGREVWPMKTFMKAFVTTPSHDWGMQRRPLNLVCISATVQFGNKN